MRNKGSAADCKLLRNQPESYRQVSIIMNSSLKATLFAAAFLVAPALNAWVSTPIVRIVHDPDVLEVEAVAPNIVRIQLQPAGKTTPRTLVMDPNFHPADVDKVRQETKGGTQTLVSDEM